MGYDNRFKLEIKDPFIKEIEYKCIKCGISNISGKFCQQCGEPLRKEEVKKYSPETLINNFRTESEDASALIKENGECSQSGSGHDIEDDLVEFSTQYPESLFILTATWDSGFGDPPTTFYIKNGKTQTCEATYTYDKFDESKLK